MEKINYGGEYINVYAQTHVNMMFHSYIGTAQRGDIEYSIYFDNLEYETYATDESDPDEVENPNDYMRIFGKFVEDSDGFLTEYTMYKDTVNGKYVFIYGDSDLYSPYSDSPDWECETEAEAWEWFDSYGEEE